MNAYGKSLRVHDRSVSKNEFMYTVGDAIRSRHAIELLNTNARKVLVLGIFILVIKLKFKAFLLLSNLIFSKS